jgi:hypothetical protein
MYTKHFAVAMLLATASASQIADVPSELSLENEEYHTAVVNSATYAFEINDFKKAEEIIKLALQTN